MSIKRISELPAYVRTQDESTVFVPLDKTGSATQKYPFSNFLTTDNIRIIESFYPILSPDNTTDVYVTRAEFQSEKTSIYTSILAESDSRVAADLLLAPKNSPVFTGIPTAPTPDTTDDTDRLATTAFVHDIIDDLIGSGIDLSAITNRLDVLEAGAYQSLILSTASNISAFVSTVSSVPNINVGDSVMTADGAIHTLRRGGTKTVLAHWIEVKYPSSVLININSNISSISTTASTANSTANTALSTANYAKARADVIYGWTFGSTSDVSGNLTITHGTGGASFTIPIATTHNAGLMTGSDKVSLANKSDVGHTHVISDVSGLQTQLNSLSSSISAIDVSGTVKYSVVQALSTLEKSRARTNIGAIPAFTATPAASDVVLSAGSEFTLTLPAATTSLAGVMTAADKTTLTNVATTAGNAVLYTSQTLTAPQKTQARTNIGAISTFGITLTGTSATLSDGGSLSVVIPEATGTNAGLLSASDKTLINSLAAAGGAVLYSSVQTLTSPQKTQARSNIDAVSTTELTNALLPKADQTALNSAVTTINTALDKRVRFDATQTLTGTEKLQAKTNIGITTPYINYPIHGEINGFVGKQSFILCDSNTTTNLFNINTVISGTPTLKKFYIDSGVLKSNTPSYLNQVISITTLPANRPNLITWYISGNVVRITVDGVIVHDFTYTSISSYDLHLFGLTGKIYMAGNTETEFTSTQLTKLMNDSWDEGVDMFLEFYGKSGISDNGYWVGAVKQSLMNEYSGIPSVLSGRKIAIRATCTLPEITVPGLGTGVNEYTTIYTNSSLKIGANTPVYTGLSQTQIPQGVFIADAFVATNNNITFRFVNTSYGDITLTPTIDVLYYI